MAMFSLTQVAVCTLVGAVSSLVAVWLYSRWAKVNTWTPGNALLIALVVALSILLWREAGNTDVLNEDPIPLVSPNDVLCPIVTYVVLGLYAQFTRDVSRPA